MKRLLNPLLVPIGLASITFATPTLSQTDNYIPPADEMSEAMAIMEVIFPADTREQIMIETAATMGNQVANSMMQGPIFEEPGIRAIMEEYLSSIPETMRPMINKHLPAMVKSTAVAYTREFTLAELQDIRAFASTPSGRRYFTNAQALLADPAVAAANEAFFADVAKAQEGAAEELRAKVVEYLENNPDVVARLEAAGVGQDK